MVVAMPVVGMVQVAIHQIVHMIAVRHGIVTASRAMDVRCIVPGACMTSRTRIGVFRRDRQHMLVYVIAVRAVQMPVVQVVHMTVMQDCGVPAALAVNVRMTFMNRMRVHRCFAP